MRSSIWLFFSSMTESFSSSCAVFSFNSRVSSPTWLSSASFSTLISFAASSFESITFSTTGGLSPNASVTDFSIREIFSSDTWQSFNTLFIASLSSINGSASSSWVSVYSSTISERFCCISSITSSVLSSSAPSTFLTIEWKAIFCSVAVRSTPHPSPFVMNSE